MPRKPYRLIESFTVLLTIVLVSCNSSTTKETAIALPSACASDRFNVDIPTEISNAKWQLPTNFLSFNDPIFHKNLMVLSTTGGPGVMAVNIEHGTTQWHMPISDNPARPILCNDLIFVGGENGTHYALDFYSQKEGKTKWEAPYPMQRIPVDYNNQMSTSYSRPVPTFNNDVVYYGTPYGQLFGRDIHTGGLVFEFNTNTEEDIVSQPIIVGGYILFGSFDGYLYSVNLLTKTLNWKFNAGNRIRYSVTVAGNQFYVCSEDAKIHCGNARTGDSLWSMPLGALNLSLMEETMLEGLSKGGSPLEVGVNYKSFKFTSKPIVLGQSVIVRSRAGIFSFNTGSGKQNWHINPCPDDKASTEQIVGYNNALIITCNNYIMFINPANGATINSYDAHAPITNVARYHNGKFFYTTANGSIHCVE